MVSGRAATGKWIIVPRTSKVLCEITFMLIFPFYSNYGILDLIDNFITIKHDDALHFLIMKY